MAESYVPMAVVLGATLGLLALSSVVIPGVMIYFYESKNVKATFAARDPGPTWTDACPPEVLTMSLWTGLGGVSMLFVPLTGNGVVPAFGRLVSGVPGAAVSVVLAVLWVYSGWAMYKLRVSGWWIAMLTLSLGFVSAVVTFAQVNPSELYRAMGVPEVQVALLEQMGYDNELVVGWMCLIAVPFLGYMVYLKRHFSRPL